MYTRNYRMQREEKEERAEKGEKEEVSGVADTQNGAQCGNLAEDGENSGNDREHGGKYDDPEKYGLKCDDNPDEILTHERGDVTDLPYPDENVSTERHGAQRVKRYRAVRINDETETDTGRRVTSDEFKADPGNKKTSECSENKFDKPSSDFKIMEICPEKPKHRPGADTLLICALIIMLLLEGGDDILIFALVCLLF